MTTRLSKPVTRLITIGNDRWNVTLGFSGVEFRAFRSPSRSAILLPYGEALTRAAWIAGAKDKKPRTRRIKRSVV